MQHPPRWKQRRQGPVVMRLSMLAAISCPSFPARVQKVEPTIASELSERAAGCPEPHPLDRSSNQCLMVGMISAFVLGGLAESLSRPR